MQAKEIEIMNLEDFKKSLEVVRLFVEQEKKAPKASSKVLVVGDVGLDKYLYGKVERISPEAPVPIVNLNTEESHLGLSANVAKNYASMGGACDLFGLIGEDSTGQEFEALLRNVPKLEAKLIKLGKRPTTEKTRVLSGQHHLLRLDHEKSSSLSDEEKELILKATDGLNFSDYAYVILEDYGKGFLFAELCQKVIEESQKAGAKVLVDPSKKASLEKFRGANIFKPNHIETLSYSEQARSESYLNILKWICEKGRFQSIVSTLGADGMSLYKSEGAVRVPTFARKVFDVTGAGDTVIAALAFGLSKGLKELEACIFANFAAGYVVGKVGAVSCSIEDIHSHMERFSTSEMILKLRENF